MTAGSDRPLSEDRQLRMRIAQTVSLGLNMYGASPHDLFGEFSIPGRVECKRS